MEATGLGGSMPLSVDRSGDLPATAADATVDEPSPPLPVFASGDPQLEQRLFQTFAALRMPRDPPAAPLAEAASAAAAAADSESVQCQPLTTTAVSPAEGQLAPRETPAAPAAAAANLAASAMEADTARAAATAAPAAAQAVPTVASSSNSCSSRVEPAASNEQPASQTSAAAAAAPGETEAAEVATAAGVAAGASDSAAALRGRGVEGQQVALLRPSASARGESPGACSEATDSTRCTDTSEVVRPPPFGTWRHYSLADVPEESMSVAGMRRACQAMLQQLRRAGAAVGTPTPDAAVAAPASSADAPASSSSLAETAAGTAGGDAEPEDPRVRVGPRRRG